MTAPQPATILVVDDEDEVRRLIAFALQRAGFEVLEASSGPAGIELVQNESVGLIVLDVSMPEMTGTEVVEILRSRPRTATLPILLMTGSGDDDSVIRGLAAGADDFLPKPVRLDELVARVKARLRTQTAWSLEVESELRTRAHVVAALGQMTISTAPDDAATDVVRELAKLTDSDAVTVLQVGVDGGLRQLAGYDRNTGVFKGGPALAAAHARTVLARTRDGPWIEETAPLRDRAFGSAEITAGAPICSGDDLVGILTIGVAAHGFDPPPVRRAWLLAAAIDYANVLGMRSGSAFADQRDTEATRTRLRHMLAMRQFHPVFQPIVDLITREVVGFEALSRFDDGIPPDVRFAEAERVGLGYNLEMATLRAAITEAVRLPAGTFLSVNASPGLVLRSDRAFRQLIKTSPMPLVLELTEHVPISDYGAVRAAIAQLGDIGLAVDDAGAGYASFRHILELRPTYAKLDLSLIRGIDGDDLRQGLAAGLQYFAYKTGCRLIAEGVETPAEADLLQRLGIELGQGYLFGRPVPLS
jgi:EAL domain-containing protein (putative c-di-GMP-specific phosphodiesterase class I)/DNA-binding response OmpR family regulator